MFGEIFGFLRDSVQFIWPFRIVEEWERAGYYVCGRWWKEMGPGLKVVVPWFCTVRTVATVDAIVGTGRQDITLADGRTLSFAATAKAKVVDVNLALNSVDDYHETMQELLASVLADKIAQVDADRLSPEKRGRLFSDLRRWVSEEAGVYGIEISNVRFTSFVLNPKTLRLLIDQQMVAAW